MPKRPRVHGEKKSKLKGGISAKKRGKKSELIQFSDLERK